MPFIQKSINYRLLTSKGLQSSGFKNVLNYVCMCYKTIKNGDRNARLKFYFTHFRI